MNPKPRRYWSNLNQLGAALIIVSLLVFWASRSSAEPASPDPPAGFWFGLFLMIAGLLLLIVSYSAQARIQNAVKLRCSACRALNDEGNRFCASCGKPL